MYIFGKRINAITTDDINGLVENKIQESKSLDYKRELKLDENKEKKEFLFDVSAFYNTEGGCLIFGIEESKDEKGQNTGTPEKICGINIENEDKLVQQIEEIIKGGTDPSISNVEIEVKEIDGLKVLIIGIPKRLGLPAMVIFRNSNKFYRRRNSGKYLVDTYELNQMFMQNQLLKEKAEDFRLKRIEKVRELKVFPTLDVSASFFIHITPFSFLNENVLDFSNIANNQITVDMNPMLSGGWNYMFNLDGYASYSSMEDHIYSYDQLFRNGIYEIYTSHLFGSRSGYQKEINCVYGEDLIQKTVEKINKALAVLQKFEVEAPFLIGISLHGIREYVIFHSKSGRISRPFMTDEIIFPEIILLTYETDVYKQMKPIFDILYQAVGYASSPPID